MTQIFHPSTNAFAKGTIFGAVFIAAALAWAGGIFVRSTYMTGVDVVRDQPVPFSHDHHVTGLGIDCRYCHTTVEDSPFAGMPATEVCMNCHSQIWRDSPLLAPVRESFRTGSPLRWTRVHDLPDFVYFDHSIHVAKGVACETCHGPVDRMPLMRKAATLHMEWCLDCHRNPELFVRAREDVFRFGERRAQSAGLPVGRGDEQEDITAASGHGRTGLNEPHKMGTPEVSFAARSEVGEQLVREYGIRVEQLSNCVICHR